VFKISSLILLTLVAPLLANGLDPDRLARLDAVVEAAIQRGDCPGAVLVVVHKNAVAYRKAFGTRDGKQPMTVDTVFDLASLTKPVATAACVMVLLERGDLRPSDKVAKHWPEFSANGKGDVTLEHCLTHTAGLIADNAMADYADGGEAALKKVAALKLEVPPGTRFRYSDVGYIVLGEVVARVSKKPLAEFAKENLFAPLKMTDTGYLPSAEWKKRAAPTGKRKNETILGEVHDPRAFALGGVAGHAGLFSTADDLARFARMLLRGGELEGKRVLGALTVRKYTEPRAVPGGFRSRGWDVDTAYTGQRGELFPAGDGYGHTGFTGTSIWIDPPSQTAVILLTNRTFNGDRASVTELRRRVATTVASAVTDAGRK